MGCRPPPRRKFGCKNDSASVHLSRPAFRTPSGPTGHLPQQSWGREAATAAAERPREGEDQEPDQSADQSAVDADILQVLADLQLEAVDERGGVPMVDHSGDIGADFRPAGQNGAQRQESQPPVDPRAARFVLFEPPAECAGGGREPRDDRFGAPRQIVSKRRFELLPQPPRLLGEHRIGEDFLFQRFASRAHFGVVREVVDPFFDQRIGLIAPRMVGVAHFFQRPRKAVDHLGGDHVVDPFGDPARGLLRHVPDDRRLVALERRLDEIEALIEQRLAGSLSPEDRQPPRGERRSGDRLDPAPRGKSDPLLDRRFRRQVERIRDDPSGCGRDRPCVALVFEPSRREPDRIDRREPRNGDARGKEIVGDEPPKRRPDAALVLRHDRGMGNRQAERTAKERDDREPVGASPDHAGFRERAEIGRPGPAWRRPPHQEINRRHENEQHRGDRSHAPQFGPLLRLGLDEVRIYEGGGFGGRRSSKLCHRRVTFVRVDLEDQSADNRGWRGSGHRTFPGSAICSASPARWKFAGRAPT